MKKMFYWDYYFCFNLTLLLYKKSENYVDFGVEIVSLFAEK